MTLGYVLELNATDLEKGGCPLTTFSTHTAEIKIRDENYEYSTFYNIDLLTVMCKKISILVFFS